MSENLQIVFNGAVAQIWLNRPDVHNALDERDVHDAHLALDRVVADPDVRVIVIAGHGPSFCAGADLRWMQRAGLMHAADNLADARKLAALLHAVATAPKPVVARVHGPAYGGGVGLISACDIAIGVETAEFALTEVRLGLAAATICPYVLGALGARQARRLILTGHRFSAGDALHYGLLHEVAAPDALDGALDRTIAALLEGGPRAQAAVKDLIRELDGEVIDARLNDLTARRLAEIRANPECREGLAAFLEKRPPRWTAGHLPSPESGA